jgi:hypothetical protein
MPNAVDLIYPSPNKLPAIAFPSTAGGGALKQDNWLPPTGPNGYPLYIRELVAHAAFQLDTAAATVVEGPDWWRAMDRISIVQLDGVKRVNELRGDQLRVALEIKCGVECLKEHADLAASQTDATRKLTFNVSMVSALVFDGDDYELAADNFARIEWTSAVLTADGFSVSGGTITLDDATWHWNAHCIERDRLLWNAVDELIALPFPASGAELETQLNGRLLDLTLHQRAADGGGSMANMTSVHLPGIFNEALTYDPDLREAYAKDRRISAGVDATDPGVHRVNSMVTEGRAVPVLWSTDRLKAWSGWVIGNLTIKTVQAVAITNLVALVRRGLPRNPAVSKALAVKYNGGQALAWKVKSAGKTRTNPRSWNKKFRAYLAMECPVPGKGDLKVRG